MPSRLPRSRRSSQEPLPHLPRPLSPVPKTHPKTKPRASNSAVTCPRVLAPGLPPIAEEGWLPRHRLFRPRQPEVGRKRRKLRGISCEFGYLNMAAPLSVEVEFGGGAELLFDGVKKHQVTLPGQEEPWDIRSLLVWIKKNLLKERPELFIQGDSVRPGILVLVNDADWELLGELDYQLQDQDSILFISTLHGG
ncbi:unnamed protein product [Nyctereutes procyonoides]|nr:unnamed protein product [Nyctereutes procyonoides]